MNVTGCKCPKYFDKGLHRRVLLSLVHSSAADAGQANNAQRSHLEVRLNGLARVPSRGNRDP